jgi:hypothetical protein
MTRRAAIALHVTLILIGALLYFLFVIPRWWVLTGQIPGTLATTGRIAAGVPIALAAIPVVLTLQRAIEPGEHTPEFVLRLRAWSALLLGIAGALILIAAVAEIWLGLGAAGPWLFAVYGAAGATAVLGVLAFYLSFVAEKPPAPPKPPKASKPAKIKGGSRWRGKRGAADDSAELATGDNDSEDIEVDEIDDDVMVVSDDVDVIVVSDDVDIEVTEIDVSDADATDAAGGLRNQRPSGKRRRLLGR